MKPPKAAVEAAVKAMQLLCGSTDRVQPRQEQRLYDRTKRAVGRVVSKSGMDYVDAWKQIETEARRRGCKLAMPGKDI